MNSYTDLEQSRKLAEILPLESADTLHCIDFDGDLLFTIPKQYSGSFRHQPELIIPCWSLVALLNVLPKNLNIGRPSLESNYKGYYWIQYYDEFMKPNNYKTECFNNPVDACYELILKLHELKML